MITRILIPSRARTFACLTALLLTSVAAAATSVRERDFNDGWRFALSDAACEAPEYDDRSWRQLELPHDWAVESPFRADLEGCTGYLPGGVGWYRKRFELELGSDQIAYLSFDGVYNRSTVWLNGRELGFRPFGYSPFHYRITPEKLRAGEPNVVAVRVDRSRYADSRWYTGSGIYRDVTLVVANQLHVPLGGVFVTTPEVSNQTATVDVATTVENASPEAKSFRLETKLIDSDGQVVAVDSEESTVGAGGRGSVTQSLVVSSPRRWGPDTPELYTAITTIESEGEAVDRCSTRFGIRTIEFDKDQGFFLNGERLLIKGVCLHHDGGAVGAAVPASVWRRRLLTLKEGGCNAIRSAHNPPSAEFLDLCDEIGLLVQDEFYDEWDYPKDKRLNMQEQSVDPITRGHHEYFQEWAERDLKATMLRDRNHPCVFQWSIGNEIEWTYPRYRPASGYFDADASGNYFWNPPRLEPAEVRARLDSMEPAEHVLADTAAKLAAWTREMDRTRPVTSNCILPSVSHVSGYADALDLVGYSYRRVVYDYARRHFPDKAVMGTENLGQWHEWKAVLERPFISGVFLWTGVDYLGEANEHWPKKGTSSGLLDTAGFEKPAYHMMKTLWSDEPHVYVGTQLLSESNYEVDSSTGEVVEKEPGAWRRRTWQWHPLNRHWNYDAGQTVVVEAYANVDRLELFFNGRSIGVKSLSDFPDRIFKWAVPFEPGEITVAAPSGVASDRVSTAGPPAAVIAEVEAGPLDGDRYDVAHIVVQLVDTDGSPVSTDDREVTFEVEGPGRLIGVDNGSLTTVTAFQAEALPTHRGRCLGLVRIDAESGATTIRVRSPGLREAAVQVQVMSDTK